ncbi:MAG: InlB B-repeat-containing protein [Candidatus Bathyarchaeota archaeon]|nr:InlB B-repeat-containing protein [Candidatus Termiticorpusculum sp.]
MSAGNKIVDQVNSSNYYMDNQLFFLGPYGQGDDVFGFGQSFTGDGSTLTHAKLLLNYLYMWSSACHVAIYAHNGTFGSNGVPTGQPLAVSDVVNLNNANPEWHTFTFSGINKLKTTVGTQYFLCLLISENSAVIGDTIGVAFTQDSSAFNGGNSAIYIPQQSSNWSAISSYALMMFQLYGESSSVFSVSYNGDGHTGGSAPTDSNSYAFGAPVTVKANTGGLVKTGYNFVGWATTSGASAPTFAVTGSNVNPPNFNMPASNVTLYAVWQPITPQTYTVTYNGNGHTSGSAPQDNNSPYNSGATVTVLGNTGNLAKANHTLLGWSTNNSATTAQYTQGQTFTINQNTTLYAVWQQTPPPPAYKVTYNGNGHTSGTTPNDNNSYQNGATVTVLGQGTLTKTSHNFLGWATTNNASSPTHTQNSTFTITQNITLYAVWQPFQLSIIDSLVSSSSNEVTFYPADPATSSQWTGWGQQFIGNGGAVTEVRWYGRRNSSSATGNVICQIFESLSAIATDKSSLATSNLVAFNSIPSSNGWFSFTFSTPFKTIAGTRYFIAIRSSVMSYATSYVRLFYAANTNLNGRVVVGRKDNYWRQVSDQQALMFQVLGTNDVEISSFNGSVVSKPIEILQNFTEVNGEFDVQYLLYPVWEGRPSDALIMPNPPIGYTLCDKKTRRYNRIFGATVKNPYNTTPGYTGSPAVVLTHHLIIGGSHHVRGSIDAKEGTFVAHGGPKLLKWGPEGPETPGQNPRPKRNPMLLIKDDGWTDNIAPDTWETRIMYNASPNPLIGNFKYKWANFTTNHLTAHGKVMCDDIVHTNAIGARTSGANVEFYNSVIPHSGVQSIKNLGASGKEWDNLYVKNLYVSGGGSVGGVQKGSSSTSPSGTTTIAFQTPFAITPTVICTIKDVSATTRPIGIIITNVTTSGFTVKTFVMTAHKHKIGDAFGTVNTPLAVDSAGSHTHTVSQDQTDSRVTGVPSTSNVVSHTHKHSDFYANTPTGSAGSHSHGLTRPNYMRQLNMRTANGGAFNIGETMTTIQNSSTTELYTQSDSVDMPVAIAADFNWLAV